MRRHVEECLEQHHVTVHVVRALTWLAACVHRSQQSRANSRCGDRGRRALPGSGAVELPSLINNLHRNGADGASKHHSCI